MKNTYISITICDDLIMMDDEILSMSETISLFYLNQLAYN